MDNFYEKYQDLLPTDFDERAEHAFYEFDTNKSGTIERRELIPFFKSVAKFFEIDPKKINANSDYKILLDYIDMNSDGKVSLKEFKNFYAMIYLDKAS
jgi:Ca2+-binding EF-hand superfamily protein